MHGENHTASIIAVPLAGTVVLSTGNSSFADEGGVSFWLPGFFGSLAAAPQVPGFSFGNILYYSQVSAGGNVAFAKQVPLGNINVNFNGNLNANVHGSAQPLYFALPGYTFATPVLGGQFNFSTGFAYGRIQSSVDATIMGNLGLGGPGFAIGRSLTETATGFGDILPMASLRWNFGVHNFMTYATGNLTTGVYHSQSIANLGIGHNAIDAGGAYTYFDQKTGREFSATLGFTYNLENTNTNYQNGVDMHLDWGTSQFLTKQWQVGLVGYWYQQLSCDSGSGDLFCRAAKCGTFRTFVQTNLRRTAARLRDEKTIGKGLSSEDDQFGFFEPDRTECGIFRSITFVQTLQTNAWSKSIQLAARTRNRWYPLEDE